VVEKDLWSNKPMLLMATSPGARGGRTLLESAVTDFPRRGGHVCAHFLLPSFYKNFKEGVHEHSLKKAFDLAALAFERGMGGSPI